MDHNCRKLIAQTEVKKIIVTENFSYNSQALVFEKNSHNTFAFNYFEFNHQFFKL